MNHVNGGRMRACVSWRGFFAAIPAISPIRQGFEAGARPSWRDCPGPDGGGAGRGLLPAPAEPFPHAPVIVDVRRTRPCSQKGSLHKVGPFAGYYFRFG